MQYPVVTICGSMRFYDRMLIVAGELTSAGYIVLMPHVTKADTDVKLMLDAMHRAKIDMSKSIVVVSDSTEYYGISTTGEINYARDTGKEVIFVTKSLGAELIPCGMVRP